MHWRRALAQGSRHNSGAALRRNDPAASGAGAAKTVIARQFSAVKSPNGAEGRLLLPKQLPFLAASLPGQRGEPIQIRFREAMMKERRPLQFLGSEATTTAGAMCGHTSLGVLALCYLETDALTLRELVITGSSLNLFFSYYRTQPLWISIKWNVLFLVINAALIGLMWKENKDAEELGQDPEQARIFRDIFMPVELSPVQFMQLMDLAQRRVVLAGNDINQHGRPHEEMFLIVEGTADVKSEGEAVCHLESGGFVGSMAFNRFIQETPVPSRLASNAAKGAAFSSSLSQEGHDGSPPDSDVGGEDRHSPRGRDGGGTMAQAAKEAILDVLRGPSVVGNVAMSLVPDVVDEKKDLSKMERSKNTVTATSDVVVYAWDMHALRAFIKRRPLIGSGIQKAISEDLVNKVDQSRGHKKRYRLLLEQALEAGEINLMEKKKLDRYRNTHGVSLEEHNALLKQRGWTHEEYEAGFRQGVAPTEGSEHFIQYEALVRRELASGEVKPESKLHLLTFRKQAGIDAQEHILALEKQGWTVDDYEVGVKGIMSKGFAGGFSSSEDVEGDTANTLSTVESKGQEQREQQQQQQQQQQEEGHEGQEGSPANPAVVARKLPVATPRPVQGLQRQRIAQ